MSSVPEPWIEAFRRANLGLDVPSLSQLSTVLEERALSPGDVLVNQGDAGDSVYFVVDGKLTAALEGDDSPRGVVLQELEAGSVVGEIALLVGGPRSATVRAVSPSRVLELTRARFDELAARSSLGETLSRALHERIRRTLIARHVRALFGDLDAATLADLEQRVRWVQVPAGKELFCAGDPPDGAYIVTLGRLRVVVPATDGASGADRVIDEISPGEWVGEMALLTNKPRSATVLALRDSELVWLPQAVFDDLVCRHPRALLSTSRLLVERLQRQMSASAGPRRTKRTFAIVPASGAAGGEIGALASGLVSALGRYGSVAHVSAAAVDAALGKPGIARSRQGDAAHLRLSPWLMSQEDGHDYVVYEADPGDSEWTQRALRHADEVLLVADATRPLDADARPMPAGGSEPRARRVLLLVQPTHASSFPGTRRWLDRVPVDAHYHVRRGNGDDLARVARTLTGNAIGVVFGGGGSRGYAHIGVVRALDELGIPVDAVGGSSIGAMISVAKGMGHDADEMLKRLPPQLRAAFRDPTLPYAAFMKGQNVLDGSRAVAGTLDVEDLLIPTFIVTTNLTRGEPLVMTRGPIALFIRASSSIPGIFPPVPWQGDLLVDGGLSNNVPLDVMTARYGNKAIAVDVIPEVDLLAEGDLPPAMSGWRAAWDRLNPRRKGPGMPSILTVLMRSATSSSQGLRRGGEVAGRCALFLRPQVSRWNMVDFGAAEPIAQEGYRESVGALREWWTKERAAHPAWYLEPTS